MDAEILDFETEERLLFEDHELVNEPDFDSILSEYMSIMTKGISI